MISVLMDSSLLLANKLGSGHSMALGYTIMVASFLLIYFGIRSYRDNTLGGRISFGRAFACGILIALITTVCYVATWEVIYFNFMPHFMDSYFAAHTALSAALSEPVRQHGLHVYGAPARRAYHYSYLRCHPPPQSACRTRRCSRSHDHVSRVSRRKIWIDTVTIPLLTCGAAGGRCILAAAMVAGQAWKAASTYCRGYFADVSAQAKAIAQAKQCSATFSDIGRRP
jgi:hypothetical protein